MDVVARRRQTPRSRGRHLTLVPDEAQPGLWDSRELVAPGLEPVRLGPCFGYADIYGAQRSLVVVFSSAGQKHAVVVLIDYLLGGGVKDCCLLDYTSKLRDEYRRVAADPDLRFSDLAGEAAREILEQALACDPCPVEADQIRDVQKYIGLVRSCVELLPRGPAAAALAVAAKRGARGSRLSAPRNVHRLKVTLRGTKPAIWRRFEVPSDITLARLHTVIQIGFGWQNSHLFVFETPAGRFGSYDPDLEIRSAASKKLSAVADWPADKIRYEYDFGDCWEHDVLVEAVQPAEPGVAYPRCTAGKRAGPPEDCGGVWGYYDLLNTLANPRHEDHAQVLWWLGIESASEFDAGEFDPGAANEALARVSKVLVKL
jgi:Plasmid pRiA4b ORF-3-like protein